MTTGETERLRRFVLAHRDHFVLGLVRVDHVPVRERAVSELEEALRADGIGVARVDYEGREIGSVLEDLRGLASGTAAVAAVTGADWWWRLHGKFGPADWARLMNLERDAFPSAWGRPLLFFLSNAMMDWLRSEAPDFFDWHAAIFHLEGERGDARWLIAAEETDWPPGSLDLAAKRLGVITEHLERLRAEQVAGSSARRIGQLELESSELLYRLGRRREALEAAQRAVEILRATDTGSADIAAALNNLANAQRGMGQVEPALRTAEDAVGLYRRLAESNADGFLPDFAMTLNNLAAIQSEVGQRETALRTAVEAVACYRRLFAANPDPFLPDLAMALNNLANMQSAVGQREMALRTASDAVGLYRSLADANPDAFLPDLARSLNNLANRQSELGQREEALRTASEAVDVYRRQANANPDAFLPHLASSLHNLASIQSAVGQREMALRTAADAVSLYRSLADANPDAFLPYLAGSLNNLASMQSEMNQRETALRTAAYAVSLYRSLADANPDAFLPYLAGSLNNLATMQREAGQRETADRTSDEAVCLYRRLSDANPNAFLPDLARSMAVQALALEGMEQTAKATDAMQDAARLLSPMFLTSPAVFGPLMGKMIREYVRLCRVTGRQPDADLLEPIQRQLQNMS